MNDLTEYVQWMNLNHKSEGTIRKYCSLLKNIPNGSAKVRGYLSENNDNRLLFAAYRSYLKYCYQVGEINNRDEYLRLLDTYKLPPKKEVNEDNLIAYPKSQWESMISKGRHYCARMTIWLGFQFGFRADEIANFREIDINFEKELVYIRTRNPDPRNKQIAWHPKWRSNRKIALNHKQAEVLRRWIEKIRPRDLDHPYLLWVGKNRRQITIHTVNYWCRSAMPRLKPHDLRRSFATNLYYATDKDVKAVQLAMGHADVGVTSKYLRLGEEGYLDIVREATAKMS